MIKKNLSEKIILWIERLAAKNTLTKFQIILNALLVSSATNSIASEKAAVNNDQFWNDLKTKRVESSGAITWEQVSPGNAGFANMLRYHPTVPGVVMLCPDMWNVYLSENDGEEWYGITDHDSDGSMQRWRDFSWSLSDENLR